jgi:hypothetical protein
MTSKNSNKKEQEKIKLNEKYFRAFQIGSIRNHIKKSWVEIKSMTKKLSGIDPESRNLTSFSYKE